MVKVYKITEILLDLAESDIRLIRKMLKSPFFGRREDLSRLFEVLVKGRQKKEKDILLENVFSRLYPGEEFNGTRIRGLMSDLLEMVEEYLLIAHHREDKIQRKLTLASIYRKRKWNKNFQSTIRNAEKAIEKNQHKNLRHYEYLLDYQEEKMNYELTSKRSAHDYFQEISHTTDSIFLLKKLKNALSLITQQSVSKTENDFGLLNYFIDQIEESRFFDQPAIALEYYCYRFLTEEKALQYFRKFKSILTESRHLFSPEDLKGPLLVGLNFCIRKVNKGEVGYGRESFDLYKTGLAQGILLENGRISRFTFNNIVAAGIMLKEWDWIAKFINEAPSLLDPAYLEQTINFNAARLEFAKNNYATALMYLQGAEYKDLVNNLIAKSLLIQIYFEMQEFESLEFHLESFRQFIRRREVSDYHRRNFKNLISYVHKIMTLPPYEKEERRKLAERIKVEKTVTLKEWLLEKLAE